MEKRLKMMKNILGMMQIDDKSFLVRITVDIEEDVLSDLMEITGDKNKSPAVDRAVTEFVRRKKAKEFGRLIREGAFDYPAPATDPAGHDFANPIPPLYPD
jgi:Arc/MetJ family transcription regulator